MTTLPDFSKHGGKPSGCAAKAATKATPETATTTAKRASFMLRYLITILLTALTLHAATPEDILGPSLPWGDSPWTGYEINAKALADTIGPAALAYQPSTVGTMSCTFDLNNVAPATMTGSCAADLTPLTLTGCTSANPTVCTVASNPDWLVDGATISAVINGTGGGCANLTAPYGNTFVLTSHTSTSVTLAMTVNYMATCAFSSGTLNPQVLVAANPLGDPAGEGRIPFVVNSIASTTVTFFGGGLAQQLQASTRTGLTVYYCGRCIGDLEGYGVGYWALGGLGRDNQQNWCHYDPASALYRMHYRTAGDTYYLGLARQWADACWVWQGRSGLVDNYSAYSGAFIQSTVVRALDGKPDRFDALYAAIKFSYDYNQDDHYPDHNDTRNSAYAMNWYAYLAKADPDSMHHADYCAMGEDVAPKWVELQAPDGKWYEISASNGYSYRPMVGASPWRMFVAFQGLAHWYDLFADTSADGCNRPDLTADIVTSLELAADWLYGAGFDPSTHNGFYDADAPANGQVISFKAGAVSISGSSTTVEGSGGTAFLTDFACNGTDYIGIVDGPVRWPFLVSSCTDNDTLTISQPYNTACLTDRYDNADYTQPIAQVDLCASSASGVTYAKVNANSTSCGTSTATYCYPAAASSSPIYLNELPWLFGKLYSITHDHTWIDKGDEIAGAAFGTHADGSGGSEACAGPDCYAHATENGYASGLGACAQLSNVPPCNATNNSPAVPAGCSPVNNTTCFHGNAFNFMSRTWAQGDGIGGFPAYLAWREMTFDTPTGAPVSLTGAVGLTGNATTH